MAEYRNLRDCGAAGDGLTDDAAAFQRALDECGGVLYIPAGTYVVGRTLKIGSDTAIRAEAEAVIRLADGALKGRGDYLLAGAGENITIEGGVWDGNAPGNRRNEEDMFAPENFTGTMLHFRGVKGLTLRGMTLRDPECYYLRLCEVSDFLVEDITFDSPHLRPNQDGVHLGGCCERGVIRRLRGLHGSPNDDFVALNADDCLTRLQNRDLVNGPIRDIVVEDVEADFCHTFVRIVSIESEVSNIRVSNVRGGCENFAINMDAMRYCRTPFFVPDDPCYTQGVGRASDVHFRDMTIRRKGSGNYHATRPLICLETNARDFTVENVRTDGNAPTLGVINTGRHRVVIDKPEQPDALYLMGSATRGDGFIEKPAGGAVLLAAGGFDKLSVSRTDEAYTARWQAAPAGQAGGKG